MSRTKIIVLFGVNTVVKKIICCGLTRLRVVSPQKFDHCDDEYRFSKRLQTTLSHCRFVKFSGTNPTRVARRCRAKDIWSLSSQLERAFNAINCLNILLILTTGDFQKFKKENFYFELFYLPDPLSKISLHLVTLE